MSNHNDEKKDQGPSVNPLFSQINDAVGSFLNQSKKILDNARNDQEQANGDSSQNGAPSLLRQKIEEMRAEREKKNNKIKERMEPQKEVDRTDLSDIQKKIKDIGTESDAYGALFNTLKQTVKVGEERLKEQPILDKAKTYLPKEADLAKIRSSVAATAQKVVEKIQETASVFKDEEMSNPITKRQDEKPQDENQKTNEKNKGVETPNSVEPVMTLPKIHRPKENAVQEKNIQASVPGQPTQAMKVPTDLLLTLNQFYQKIAATKESVEAPYKWHDLDQLAEKISQQWTKIVLSGDLKTNPFVGEWLKEWESILEIIQHQSQDWSDPHNVWQSWSSEKLKSIQGLKSWLPSTPDIGLDVPKSFKNKADVLPAQPGIPQVHVDNLQKVADYLAWAEQAVNIQWSGTCHEKLFYEYREDLVLWDAPTVKQNQWKEKALDFYAVCEGKLTLKVTNLDVEKKVKNGYQGSSKSVK